MSDPALEPPSFADRLGDLEAVMAAARMGRAVCPAGGSTRWCAGRYSELPASDDDGNVVGIVRRRS